MKLPSVLIHPPEQLGRLPPSAVIHSLTSVDMHHITHFIIINRQCTQVCIQLTHLFLNINFNAKLCEVQSTKQPLATPNYNTALFTYALFSISCQHIPIMTSTIVAALRVYADLGATLTFSTVSALINVYSKIYIYYASII